MLKAFFRDSIVYGLAKMLTGAIALIALPIYTRALSPADYGVVDLVTAVAAIGHVMIALEISQGFGRYVPAADGRDARAGYTSTALWFTVGAYSLFAAIVFPFAQPISVVLFGSDAYTAVTRASTLVIWSTGIFYLVQNVLRYERRAGCYAVVSILFSLLSLAVTVWLLLVVGSGLIGVFVGQFAAGVVAASVGLWYSRRSIALIFDRRRWREMVWFSAPLVPSGLGIMLTTYVDRYAIVRLLSLDDLGLYGVAFRLASIVGVALAGVVSAVAPLIYQHHHEPGTPAQIARMFHWFLALALPLVLFLGLFAPELTRLVAPAAYRGATSLVFVLSAAILIASCYNFAPGLWIAKRTGRVALIGLASGAINLVLNLVLIPRLGLIGAGVSTLTSASLACIAHFASSQALYPVPFRWRRLIGAGLLVAVTGVVIGRGATDGWLPAQIELLARAAAWLLVSAITAALLVGAQDVRLASHRLRQVFS